jgi:hypothetical protein
VRPTDKEIKDVILHLFTEKYTKKEKLEVLSFLEQKENLELCHSLFKKHWPQYYIEGDSSPIMKFNLLKDLGYI